jgi:archaeosine synthase
MRLKLTLDEVTPIEYICQPEFERFVSYVLENFQPNGKKILVILPCAAKKPYASSKTQRKYIQTIREAAGDKYHLIQEATLSGVLGVVPREMETAEVVLNYNFFLNRSKYTRGFHVEIMDHVAQLVARFANKFGQDFDTIITYGRERYRTAAQLAAERACFPITVLPSSNKRLLREGLSELAEVITESVSRLD